MKRIFLNQQAHSYLQKLFHICMYLEASKNSVFSKEFTFFLHFSKQIPVNILNRNLKRYWKMLLYLVKRSMF